MHFSGRIKLSYVLGDAGGILYFVLHLRGVAQPPLRGPALQTQVLRCLCFSLFFQALVVTGLCFALSHTHLSASKTNTQLHEGSRKRAQPPETQKHYANETGTAVPFFCLSLFPSTPVA